MQQPENNPDEGITEDARRLEVVGQRRCADNLQLHARVRRE